MTVRRNDQGHVRMPEPEFEAILARAAEEGAKRALADVGLEGKEAALDIRNLRSLVECIRLVRRTAVAPAGAEEAVMHEAAEAHVGRIEPIPVPPQEVLPADHLRHAEKRAELSPAEIDGLRRMGMFVGTSPRTVKRVVNVYRLVRAMQTGSDLARFVEGRNGPPFFEPVQLCLAVQFGLNAAAVEAFRSGCAAERDDDDAAFKPFLDALQDSRDRQAAERILTKVLGRAASRAELREAWERTERFAFWSVHAHSPRRSGGAGDATEAVGQAPEA